MAIFSVFPGVGKSYLFTHPDELFPWVIRLDKPNPDIKPDWPVMFDSDSSSFSKDPSFPKNYVDYIEECQRIHPVSIQFVSTHDAVREEMARRGLIFTVISPVEGLKQDFLRRYVERGSPDAFVELMDERFDDFVASCDRTDYLPKGSAVVKIPAENPSMLADIIRAFAFYHTAFQLAFEKMDPLQPVTPFELYNFSYHAKPDTDFYPVTLADYDVTTTTRAEAYAHTLRMRDQYYLPDPKGRIIAWKAGTLFRITSAIKDPTKPARLDDAFYSVTKDVSYPELEDLIKELNDIVAPQEGRVTGFNEKRILFAARDKGWVKEVEPATILVEATKNTVYVNPIGEADALKA